MHRSPLITVTMRTHNRADYLQEAAQSVIAQTFSDWELLISDDASSDETPDVCRRLMLADKRIRVVRHEPGLGAPENWRFCLAEGQGRYFAALDDDNRYLPAFLENTVSMLAGHPRAAFAFTDRWMIDHTGQRDQKATDDNSARYGRKGRVAGLCADTPLAAIQQAPEINSALFVREALVSAGGFRHLAGDLADFDVFLNLASLEQQGCYVPGHFVEYRMHPGCDSYTYRTSLPKAYASVAILESVRFEGAAERIRRSKLAQAHLNLSRVLLLHGDVAQARAAARMAWRIRPGHWRTLLIRAYLQLPSAFRDHSARKRYRTDLARDEAASGGQHA